MSLQTKVKTYHSQLTDLKAVILLTYYCSITGCWSVIILAALHWLCEDWLKSYTNKVFVKMVDHHRSWSSQSSTVHRCCAQPLIREITSALWSVPLHSYKDYRSNEDYSLTPQFWLILAVRFAFVILFEVSHLAHRQNKHNPETHLCLIHTQQVKSVSWAIKIWVLSLMKTYFHRWTERLHS